MEPWEHEAVAMRIEREDKLRRDAEAAESEAAAAAKSLELAKAAATNAHRVRTQDEQRQHDEFQSLLDGIIQRAEKATGLTREQMLAMPDGPPAEVKVDERQVAANRGVPEKHLRSIVDKVPIECDALAEVRKFLGDGKTFLVLSSVNGRYKSGSACWALTQKSGLYLKAADLSGIVAGRDQESITTWRAARRVGLLVLDDLGADYFDEKGWFLRALNSLIDTRYEGVLKTIVTTNLDARMFKGRCGERIVDRIREDGSFVSLAGESIRQHWSERDGGEA